MNILKSRWPYLKRELPSFLFVSAVQIWINFNFPAIVRLPSPWNMVVPAILTLFCIPSLLLAFLFPDFISFMIDDIVRVADSTANPTLFKRVYVGFIIGMYHVGYLFMWYKNFYGMPDIWYLLLYLYTVTFTALVYRSIQRYKSREL